MSFGGIEGSWTGRPANSFVFNAMAAQKASNGVELGVGRRKTQRTAPTMNDPAGEITRENAFRGIDNDITLSKSSAEHTIMIADA